MNLFVVGSTGPLGREFLAQAMEASHVVRALARDPSALKPAPSLEVVRGDVFDQPSLDAAARGQDAAVVILGLPFSALRKPTNLYSQGTRNVIVALKRASVRRLIVVSSFGVGDSRRDANLLERAFFSLALRGAYADKNLQEQAVRESGLDYTIVRPTRFTTSAEVAAIPRALALAQSRLRWRGPTSPALFWTRSAPVSTSARPSLWAGQTRAVEPSHPSGTPALRTPSMIWSRPARLI